MAKNEGLVLEVEDLNGWHIGATTILLSFRYGDRTIARILIDAGLGSLEREGIEYLSTRNLDKLEQIITEQPRIEHIIISHAHEDHCGALPWLVKICKEKGIPPPKIHTHRLTRDQFKIAQRNFFEIFMTPARNTGEKYCWGLEHIEEAFTLLESCSYKTTCSLYEDLEGRFSIDFKLHPNGHIVGSSLVEILIRDRETRIGRVIYTSDISLRNGSFLVDGATSTLEKIREPPPTVVITESTYLLKGIEKGDRTYIKEELAKKIKPVLENKGNVVLAVYSIDRASNVLVCLREMVEGGQLPPGVPIIFDTTTGQAIDARYVNAIEEYFGRTFNLELEWEKGIFADNLRNRWNTQRLLPTQKADKSYIYKEVVFGDKYRKETIEKYKEKGCIVVATSATFQGGPIMEYLKEWGKDSKNLFLIMGGAIPGTKAERLVRQKTPFLEKLRIFDSKSGKYFEEIVEISATIQEFDVMSAHATCNELRGIFGAFKPKIFLITHLGARKTEKEHVTKERVEKILTGKWGIRNFALLSAGHKYSFPLKILPFQLILDEELWKKLKRIGETFEYKMITPDDWKRTLRRMLSIYEELYKKGIRREK